MNTIESAELISKRLCSITRHFIETDYRKLIFNIKIEPQHFTIHTTKADEPKIFFFAILVSYICAFALTFKSIVLVCFCHLWTPLYQKNRVRKWFCANFRSLLSLTIPKKKLFRYIPETRQVASKHQWSSGLLYWDHPKLK